MNALRLALLLGFATWGCAPAPPGSPKVASPASGGVEIASPAGPGSAQPAFDASSPEPMLSWIEPAPDGTIALRFASFRDGTFAAPRTIASDAAMVRDPADAPGVRRLGDGSLFAFWSVKNSLTPYAHDLVTSVSRDGGITWSPALRPHTDRSPVEHGFASVVADPSGLGATVFWLDGRDAETALFAARWDGTAFSAERRIDPRVCDCCRTAALAAPGGALVAYRDRAAGEVRDISVVTVTAAESSPPRLVHDDQWTINACPTNGPAIVEGPSGTVLVAWFTAAGNEPAVLAALSSDRGVTFAPPAMLDTGTPIGRADAVAMAGGFAVTWLAKAASGAEVRARLVGPDGRLGPAVVAATSTAIKGTGTPAAARASDGRLLVAWTDPLPSPRVRIAAVDLPL